MVQLTRQQQDRLDGKDGRAAAIAMRVLSETARILGADSLVDIESAHIDSCLYHGDSGTVFAEWLVEQDGSVAVPTTLNVGSLDLLRPERVQLAPETAAMARRLMQAYLALGCTATWTCAPYQAGHRPRGGSDVAWGESNAVVFCNSVLGARTNRYGDFLDICAAIAQCAPRTGLHVPENRLATVAIDTAQLPVPLFDDDALYPVLGSWIGRHIGDEIAVLTGLPVALAEDRLKALGAAAASAGSVALFHAVGSTPEAPDLACATGGRGVRTVRLDVPQLRDERARLVTAASGADARIDAVAIGSPHASFEECRRLAALLDGRRCRVPLYLCTGRHVLAMLNQTGMRTVLEQCGVEIVVDTCIVVTPILRGSSGVLMTNSGKFAHYTPSLTGYDVLYAGLAACVASAVSGIAAEDPTWV